MTSPSTTAPKRLRKSTSDKQIAGVCSGLARYLGIDPVIVRVVWLVAAVAGGFGFLAYIIAAFVLPDDDHEPDNTHVASSSCVPTGDGRKVAGLVLLGVALLLFVDHDLFFGQVIGPLVLIGAGAWLILRDRSDGDATADTTEWSGASVGSVDRLTPRPRPQGSGSPTDHPQGSGSPTDHPQGSGSPTDHPQGSGSLTHDRVGVDGHDPDPTGFGLEDEDDEEVDRLLAAAAAYERGDHLLADMPPAPPEPPVENGPRLTLAGLGVLILVGGALALVDATGWMSIGLETVLAILLAVTGVALLAGSFLGRVRGLIPVGIVLALLLAGTSAITVPIRGGVGDRTIVVRRATDLPVRSHLAAGELVIDLRPLVLGEGRIEHEATVAAGVIRVLVDDDVTVEGIAQVDLGEIDLPGSTAVDDDGIDLSRTFTVDGGPGTVVLDLGVGLGQIEIVQEND